MADIFISYASKNRDRVKPLVDLLEQQSFSVWWDRALTTGTAFDREIEQALDEARCVIVLWSYASLESDWVRAEASDALDRNILVPVLIDQVRPPLIFRNIQTIEFLGWPTDRSANAINSLFKAVEQTLGGEGLKPEQEVTEEKVAPSNSVAVLPFRSLSPDPNDEFFAEGLAEEVRNVLSQISDLSVASYSSSLQFKDGQGGDSRAIGAQLNVRYLLEGSVRKAGNNFRVSVQLTQALDGYTHWSQKYDCVLEDIFSVQDQIAGRVASALKSTLWEGAIAHQARNRTDNFEAYKAYLMAMHYDREMHKGGQEQLVLVRKYAEEAVELDPNFVPAWALLALVYLNRMGFRMSLEEAHPLARNALEKAIALDPENPSVLLQLAELYRGEGKKREALTLFEKVRSLAPDAPHADYATLLLTLGMVDRALRELELCNDSDPENVSNAYYYAAALYGARRVPEAIEQFKKSLVIVGDGFLSDGIRATLVLALLHDGRKDEATEYFAPCLKPNPDRTELERGMITGLQAILDDPDSAKSSVEQLEKAAANSHVDPQSLFWAYYGLQDADKTYAWMEKLVAEDSFPTIYYLKTWPYFNRLREDERCGPLLERAGID